MLALAGGAAMAGKGKGEISSNRPSGIDAAMKVASNVGESVAAAPKSKWISPRMFGHGPDAGAAGQDIRAGLSKRVRGVLPPSQLLSPNRVHVGRGLKSGGRVTGIAKRGFGRALMKGKK